MGQAVAVVARSGPFVPLLGGDFFGPGGIKRQSADAINPETGADISLILAIIKIN